MATQTPFGAPKAAGSTPPPPAAPAVHTEQEATASDYVTVACKHPAGIHLRTFTMQPSVEAMPGGSREVKIPVQDDQEFFIKGNRAPHGQQHAHVDVETGYALTHNVPRLLWDKWFEANKSSDLVKNRVIFATASNDRGQILENKDRRSGLEPLDPEKPTRGIRKFDAKKMDNE